jgi:hypothetical protein
MLTKLDQQTNHNQIKQNFQATQTCLIIRKDITYIESDNFLK